MRNRHCDTRLHKWLFYWDKFFDKTCCSPNSTLPGQLMYGAAIIGWSSREIVPNVWISHPHNGARNREVDSLRDLNTDLGHGLVGKAKIFKHSVTAERRARSEKEDDTLRTKMVGWQV